MTFVHPSEVEALRASLGPRIAEAVGRVRSPEADAIARQWASYVARRATWASAPEELEQGRDLEARLRLLVAPPPAVQHTTGTIAGAWTMGELRDLVAAEVYQLQQLADVEGCPAWAAADPQGFGEWAARVYDARKELQASIDYANGILFVVPEAVMNITPTGATTFLTIGAPNPWDRLIAAAHPFVDLLRQMNAAGFCKPPDMSGMPQPKAPDFDLKAYNWSGGALQSVANVASEVASTGRSALIAAAFGVGAVALLLLVRK